MILASILFATFSCKNDEVENPTLTLSEMSVQLPKAASEKAITVATNQEEWAAMANAEWIHLIRDGNTLTIKVDENLTTQKRRGEVAVLALITKIISVEQEGSAVSIVTMPDKLEVDQWGGKFQFDVESNTQDWTISTDAKWLKLTPKRFKGEVIVEIDENFDRADRVAKLIFQSQGKLAQEFTVAQSGIMYNILPFMEFGKTADDINEFELGRRSKLLAKPGWFVPYWQFETKSEAFNLIHYEVIEIKNKERYKLAKVFAKSSDFFDKEKTSFVAFLKDHGFEDKGNNVFFNTEKNVEAIIKDTEEKPYVQYRFIPKQTKAYTTFSEFPYGLLEFYTADSLRVAEYEKINGGKLNPEKSTTNPDAVRFYHWYDVKRGDAYARSYFIQNQPDDKTMVETAQYFSKQSLVFWDYEGEAVLTNEFMALAKKEGFEYVKLEDEWHKFINVSKKLNMAIIWIKYPDVDIPVVDIHLWQLSSDSSNKDSISNNERNNICKHPNHSFEFNFFSKQ